MQTWPVTVERSGDDAFVRVELSESVYPTAAVQGAAAWLIPRAWVRIEAAAPGRAAIVARPKRPLSDDELRALGGELLNELLHQALRLDVGARTEKLRELVIGKAIMSSEIAAEAPLGDEPVQFADDPIGKPWTPAKENP